ncbi:Pr6Pr family membrane protein [Streptomyces sp. NPDC087294]|uniref:Pr6Pr family membrane protein n=1 Tax=Streptomyces sp. NPDC087294 TaxID=3365777 RepID=UPI00380E6D5A
MTTPIPRDIPDLPVVPGIPALLPAPVPASAVVAPVRHPLTAVYRLLIALAAVTGVTIELFLGSPVRVLTFFAVQSNILLALVCVSAARRAWSAGRPLPSALTGATLLYVMITGAVYHLLLADGTPPFTMTPTVHGPSGWASLASQLLQTVTPVAAALDWLLLTPPARLRVRQASTWMLYPLIYLALTLTRGELILPGTSGRYLYPFLDIDLHGYKSVLSNALLLGLACYALAVVLVAVDHARPNTVHHRAKTGFRL